MVSNRPFTPKQFLGSLTSDDVNQELSFRSCYFLKVVDYDLGATNRNNKIGQVVQN